MQFKYLMVFLPHVRYLPVRAKGLNKNENYTWKFVKKKNWKYHGILSSWKNGNPDLDSHHNLSAICSVFNTITHRARTVCANPQLLCKVEEDMRDAIVWCKYPTWALNRLETKNKHRYSNTQAQNSFRYR